MPRLTTILSAHLGTLYDFEGKVVVIIDVLRATTTISTIMAKKPKMLMATDDVSFALDLKKNNSFLTVGERNGKKIPGFDFGNSPYELSKAELKEKKLVITTTNGTKIMKMAERADEILVGSFHNLDALIERLLLEKREVVLFCAGWKGKVNMEDTLFAGALVSDLQSSEFDLDDSSKIAWKTYLMSEENLLDWILECEHPKRLKTKFKKEDIKIGFERNKFGLVPKVHEMQIIL